MRKRGHVRRVKLFSYNQHAGKWIYWIYRWITRSEAERLVEGGEAKLVQRMLDGKVQVVGYQATKLADEHRPSPATLTVWTMHVVQREAMRCRLSRRERDELQKFRVWPLIGDTKAVAVRPRMTHEERAIAEKLLAAGGERRARRAS